MSNLAKAPQPQSYEKIIRSRRATERMIRRLQVVREQLDRKSEQGVGLTRGPTRLDPLAGRQVSPRPSAGHRVRSEPGRHLSSPALVMLDQHLAPRMARVLSDSQRRAAGKGRGIEKKGPIPGTGSAPKRGLPTAECQETKSDRAPDDAETEVRTRLPKGAGARRQLKRQLKNPVAVGVRATGKRGA
jgi:hypothetical protein